MSDNDWLAHQFQENRGHLRSVAYRMLGSTSEADDAIQEVWFRLSRSDTSEVANLSGWLTTVVARVCLDMLRSRKSRRERPLDDEPLEPLPASSGAAEVGSERALADTVGPALLVVLELLAPAERVAFVLHDMFDLPFDEISSIIGRSPAATRQLASRARRRVRGVDVPDAETARHRDVVNAFLAASRDGNFDALLALLAPDVVLRADELAIRVASGSVNRGAPVLAPELRGARAVATSFKGRAGGATFALIDGFPGLVWAPHGRLHAAFMFMIDGDQIVDIELAMDPERIATLRIERA
ncbi:MAG: sigma-70 family RNA polymerase sigma factor [Kofleriaceae bacterium]